MAEHGEPLTDREKEIMELVATGVTNRQIAHDLGISTNTVKVHLRNTFIKLGAESRTEATMIAVRENWITLEGVQGQPAEESGPPSPVPTFKPLPKAKRWVLIAALLVSVSNVVATNRPQASQDGNGPFSPPPSPGEEPAPFVPETSIWRERAQMPTRRAYAACAKAQGHILAIAGETPREPSGPSQATGVEVTKVVEMYDPEEDLWSRGEDKPTPVTYVAAATIGSEVFVPGGCDGEGNPTRVVEVYNAETDTWRQASQLPAPRCAYALASTGNNLYLFGGWDGQQYVATTYVYKYQADEWTEGRPMDLGIAFAAATGLGNRIYVAGGYDGQHEMNACAYYDPASDQWDRCSPLIVGRGGLGLVNLGGYLYAIGGGGWTGYLGFNERYNPQTDTWEAVETPLVHAWRGPAVVALETSIYAIGGQSSGYLSLNLQYEALPFRIFVPVTQQQ